MLAGNFALNVLGLAVAILIIFSAFRILVYFFAVARALSHVGGTGKFRYLISLSSWNFPAASQLMTTDAGKAAHDRVVHHFRRAMWPTLTAIAAAFVAIGIGFVLQATGLVAIE